VRVAVTVLVVVGVLIVMGFVALGVGVYNKATAARAEPAVAESALPAEAAPAAPAAPRSHSLDLPEGARIAEMLSAGNRVVFRVVVPGAGDRLYVLDPATGAVTATLALQAGAAP